MLINICNKKAIRIKNKSQNYQELDSFCLRHYGITLSPFYSFNRDNLTFGHFDILTGLTLLITTWRNSLDATHLTLLDAS
jgi:hypothetical protein